MSLKNVCGQIRWLGMLMLMAVSSVAVEAETFTAEHVYRIGDRESRIDARSACVAELRAKLAERLGAWVESTTEVKDMEFSKRDIRVSAAALMPIEVTKESWSWSGRELTCKGRVDSTLVQTKERLTDDDHEILYTLRYGMEPKEIETALGLPTGALRIEASVARLGPYILVFEGDHRSYGLDCVVNVVAYRTAIDFGKFESLKLPLAERVVLSFKERLGLCDSGRLIGPPNVATIERGKEAIKNYKELESKYRDVDSRIDFHLQRVLLEGEVLLRERDLERRRISIDRQTRIGIRTEWKRFNEKDEACDENDGRASIKASAKECQAIAHIKGKFDSRGTSPREELENDHREFCNRFTEICAWLPATKKTIDKGDLDGRQILLLTE